MFSCIETRRAVGPFFSEQVLSVEGLPLPAGNFFTWSKCPPGFVAARVTSPTHLLRTNLYAPQALRHGSKNRISHSKLRIHFPSPLGTLTGESLRVWRILRLAIWGSPFTQFWQSQHTPSKQRG